MQTQETQSIEALAQLLDAAQIDWEPRFRYQRWSPSGRLKTGL